MKRSILSEVNGWTPLIDNLVSQYGLITAAVFGRVLRYSQMYSGVCRASLPTIAADLGLSRATVRQAMKRLTEDGYIVDITPELTGRVHFYKVTEKITSVKYNLPDPEPTPLQQIDGSQLPLQHLEGYVNEPDKPLQEIAGPLQDLEGYPSSKCTGPLQQIATNHNTLLRDSLNQRNDSVTENSNHRPAKAWRSAMDQLKIEMPRAAFETYVAQTEYLSFTDGTFFLQAPTCFIRDWMTSRMSSTITRLLTGIMNQSVNVMIVERAA